MLRSALLLPAAIATVALTGCALEDDGPRVTQTRDVADFTRTDVRDGVLRVSFDHHGFGGNDVVVEASVPRLTGVTVSGSGDIDADNIRADSFDVRSDGSADIALTGTVGRLAVDLDGSGDANVAGLVAGSARVSLGGSGDASVRADDALDVRLDGSGDVKYSGNPRLTKNLDGSGDLKRRD